MRRLNLTADLVSSAVVNFLLIAVPSIALAYLLIAIVYLFTQGFYLTAATASVAVVSVLYNEMGRRLRVPPPPLNADPYTADTPTGWWWVMVLRPTEPWYFESYEKWLRYITCDPPMEPRYFENYDKWLEYVARDPQRLPKALPLDKKPQSHDSMHEEGLLERYYKMQVGLYEKYLDLLIKFSVFNFAVTGAILSFFFSHLGTSLIRWSLIFPILMNAFFAVLVLLAYRSLERINKEINYMASFLRFLPPGVDTLRQALLISFILLLSMVGGLSVTFDLHPLIYEQFKIEEEARIKKESKESKANVVVESGASASEAPSPSPEEPQTSPSPAQSK